jgi:hypothetical protein
MILRCLPASPSLLCLLPLLGFPDGDGEIQSIIVIIIIIIIFFFFFFFAIAIAIAMAIVSSAFFLSGLGYGCISIA